MFSGVPFRHPARAQRNLPQLEPLLEPARRELLAALLRHSPDPDQALACLERFLSATEGAAATLRSASRLNALLAVFANSGFLSEMLFQRPDLLDEALAPPSLYRVLSAEELKTSLETRSDNRRPSGWRPSSAATCCASRCGTCSVWRRWPR